MPVHFRAPAADVAAAKAQTAATGDAVRNTTSSQAFEFVLFVEHDMNKILSVAAAICGFAVIAAGCASTPSGAAAAADTVADNTAAKADAAADAAAGAETAAPSDSAAGADTTKDVATVDAKKDVAPPKPTWGECTGPTDQACLQSCATGGCNAEIQGCLGDIPCKAVYDCISNCAKTPPVMPPQEATPVAQLANEATATYCQRVCFIQGGNVATAKLINFNSCIIGKCLDCDKVTPQLTGTCKAQCGAMVACTKEQAACGADTDCLDVAGCVAQCSDETCANDCAKAGKGKGAALYKNVYDCTGVHKDDCVAP